MREETGLDVEVGPVVEVLDRIMRDDDGRVQYHFVLIDYLCRPARRLDAPRVGCRGRRLPVLGDEVVAKAATDDRDASPVDRTA